MFIPVKNQAIKTILTVCIALSIAQSSFAQLSIPTVDTNFTVDFENTVTGINNGIFTAGGFAPNAEVGQLDSDGIVVNGFSDGDILFGETSTSNTDFDRGSSEGGVGPGGVYAFDRGGGNVILGVQPTGSDFNSGQIVMRIQNNTGGTITGLSVSYNIAYLNNGSNDRSNSLDFSYSTGLVSGDTIGVDALDFSTPGASDILDWQTESRSTNIDGLALANGDFFLLIWEGDDVSGTGSRDEYGIDDIVVSATNAATDLIITEIMYDPNSNDNLWEWVEVFNNGSTVIDMSGFVFDDDDGTVLGAPNISSGSIAPGTSAILYDLGNSPMLSITEFEAAWGSGLNLIAVENNWPTMANGGDRIGLWNFVAYNGRDFSGSIDEVTYDDGPVFPDNNNAASIYLTDLTLDNGLATSWALSVDGAITPVGSAIVSSATTAGSNNSGGDIGSPMANIPLPVELISFKGFNDEGHVLLTWQTAQEIDNDRFEIERRSEDGSYEVVGTLKGVGNSINVENYSFTDAIPFYGSNFYRLKQVDFDGQFEFSDAIFVHVPDDGTLQVFPNPFSKTINIKLGDQEELLGMLLYDVSGKVIVVTNNLDNELSEATLSIYDEIEEGIYFLKIFTDRREVMQRMIKR